VGPCTSKLFSLFANDFSAKLYEIGAGTTEIRKMVIGRVSAAKISTVFMIVVANIFKAFNKEYSSYAS